MRRNSSFVICTFCVFLIAAFVLPASAQSGLPAPPMPPLPRVVVPVPPSLALIPGTYAYFAPDVGDDMLFYGGNWYRPYRGRWYISSHYNGPWGFIAVKKVPRVLINLPSGYRDVPPGHQRIPYGQLKKNWRTWEQERHWDKPGKQGKRGKKNKKESEEQPQQGFSEGRVRGHGR